MTANRAKPRMKRKTFHLIATTLSMLAYVVLVRLSADVPVLIWPAFAAGLLGIVFGCFWMAALDEAAQQAHYIAWFWGGSVGLLVSMVVFATLMLRPEAFEQAFAALSASEGFVAGIFVGVIPPVIGYAIWWAVLWLRRG